MKRLGVLLALSMVLLGAGAANAQCLGANLPDEWFIQGDTYVTGGYTTGIGYAPTVNTVTSSVVYPNRVITSPVMYNDGFIRDHRILDLNGPFGTHVGL